MISGPRTESVRMTQLKLYSPAPGSHHSTGSSTKTEQSVER